MSSVPFLFLGIIKETILLLPLVVFYAIEQKKEVPVPCIHTISMHKMKQYLAWNRTEHIILLVFIFIVIPFVTNPLLFLLIRHSVVLHKMHSEFEIQCNIVLFYCLMAQLVYSVLLHFNI